MSTTLIIHDVSELTPDVIHAYCANDTSDLIEYIASVNLITECPGFVVGESDSGTAFYEAMFFYTVGHLIAVGSNSTNLQAMLITDLIEAGNCHWEGEILFFDDKYAERKYVELLNWLSDREARWIIAVSH